MMKVFPTFKKPRSVFKKRYLMPASKSLGYMMMKKALPYILMNPITINALPIFMKAIKSKKLLSHYKPMMNKN